MKIPFPIKGIDENWSYENQPPMTCRAASNVRAYDPASGRALGAQRTGLTAYVSAAVNTTAVQEINHVVESNDDFSYANVSPPTEVWEKAIENPPLAVLASDARPLRSFLPAKRHPVTRRTPKSETQRKGR